MTAFSGMVDALFDNDDMAKDAVYTPVSGDPQTVRVIFSQASEDVRYGDRQYRSETTKIEVRKSEVTSPERNAKISVDDKTYVIQSVEPKCDGIVLVLDVSAGASE